MKTEKEIKDKLKEFKEYSADFVIECSRIEMNEKEYWNKKIRLLEWVLEETKC